MDNGIVPAELIVQRRAYGGPQIVRSWPICRAIDGPPVAEHDGWIVAICRGFEFPLNVEDGSLRGAQRLPISRTRKAAAENNAGPLRQNLDVHTERPRE